MPMILTSTGIVAINEDGKATICLKKPILCKTCDRMVMLLINEGGSTRCTTCPDPKEKLNVPLEESPCD